MLNCKAKSSFIWVFPLYYWYIFWFSYWGAERSKRKPEYFDLTLWSVMHSFHLIKTFLDFCKRSYILINVSMTALLVYRRYWLQQRTTWHVGDAGCAAWFIYSCYAYTYSSRSEHTLQVKKNKLISSPPPSNLVYRSQIWTWGHYL